LDQREPLELVGHLLLFQDDLAEVNFPNLLATFSWTGIVLLAMATSQIISGYLLTPLLSIIGLSTFNSTLLALVFIPAFVGLRLLPQPTGNKRRYLLAFGVVEVGR
jgi:multidrug efflux pump subunit AcrB